jgi:uncharacterized Zn finger protein (UPF0148 family)
MFRKIAIALVAASVFTAPVLAQTTTPSDSTSAPTTSAAPKTEKSITKVTKHRVVGRHHRHGAKMAKYTKSHGKMVKFAKYGKYSHPTKHGKTAKLMSGARASVKSIPSTKPRSSKPAAKQSID